MENNSIDTSVFVYVNNCYQDIFQFEKTNPGGIVCWWQSHYNAWIIVSLHIFFKQTLPEVTLKILFAT